MKILYPTGSVLINASVSVPNGWTACNGALLDGTLEVYKDLYNLIGTTYGGSGTNFALPNLGGRVIVGVKSSTTSGLDGPVGSWLGASSVAPSANQLGNPGHSHPLVDPGHTHTPSSTNTSHQHNIAVFDYGLGVIKNQNTTAYGWDAGTAGSTYSSTSVSVNVSFNETTPSISASTVSIPPLAHNNLQPVVASNYIIKL